VAKPIEFVADGGVWRCADTACVAETTQDETFGWSQCHAVAKQAGSAVTEFKDEFHVLQPTALDRCNAHVGVASQTASSQAVSQTAAR
jgi:hypothetical protein